jgi:hypothetical protein
MNDQNEQDIRRKKERERKHLYRQRMTEEEKK